ncbi:MAG TPA: EamA family transporter [Candidatus Paceibacterota bacterium]
MWIFYALLAAVFAAAVAIFGKLGLKNIDPTLATTVRAVIMAAFLVATAFALQKFNGFSLSTFTGKEWLLVALAGIAGALSWLFYFTALKSGPAGGVAALDRLSVVFVVLLAALFLGEALTWKTILGAILITGGALLFVL